MSQTYAWTLIASVFTILFVTHMVCEAITKVGTFKACSTMTPDQMAKVLDG